MQPQQPPQLSVDALHMLYRDLGEARHGVYERNIKILALQAEVERLQARLRVLDPESATSDSAPTPLDTRKQKEG